MSKAEILRALVNERLAAAAADIFVLFERTIAEYEEELCRSREEEQKQHLYPKIDVVRGNDHSISWSDVNQIIIETNVKEKAELQRIKQEEEHLPEPVPESSAVSVKYEETENFSPLRQIQTENREETQGKDIDSETPNLSETEEHSEDSIDPNDEEWKPSSNYQVLSTDTSTQQPPEAKATTETLVQVSGPGLFCFDQVHDRVVSMDFTDIANNRDKAERVEYQCPICQKMFANKRNLLRHISIHTGEKCHSCPICSRQFTQKSNLDSHKRVHTGEKPFRCTVCCKSFARKNILESHMRRHAKSNPTCTVCYQVFSNQSDLNSHMSTHLLPDSDDSD